jgi:hypothetical protein
MKKGFTTIIFALIVFTVPLFLGTIHVKFHKTEVKNENSH